MTNVDDTFYVIGTVAGPHPYPMLVRDFNSVVGREVITQSQDMLGRLPDALVACVGGGSNAIGLFHPLIPVRRHRRCTASKPAATASRPAATRPRLSAGKPGVLHGNRTYVMADDDGQIIGTHSISAGLDYPRRRPRALVAEGHRPGQLRVGHRRPKRSPPSTNAPASKASSRPWSLRTRWPYAKKLAPTMARDQIIVVNMSGRGDKDIFTIAKREGINLL